MRTYFTIHTFYFLARDHLLIMTYKIYIITVNVSLLFVATTLTCVVTFTSYIFLQYVKEHISLIKKIGKTSVERQ